MNVLNIINKADNMLVSTCVRGHQKSRKQINLKTVCCLTKSSHCCVCLLQASGFQWQVKCSKTFEQIPWVLWEDQSATSPERTSCTLPGVQEGFPLPSCLQNAPASLLTKAREYLQLQDHWWAPSVGLGAAASGREMGHGVSLQPPQHHEEEAARIH